MNKENYIYEYGEEKKIKKLPGNGEDPEAQEYGGGVKKDTTIVPSNPAAFDGNKNSASLSSGLSGVSGTEKADADVGVRSTLEGMGFSSDSLDYDGKNVTLGGKSFLTPDRVSDEGRSYVEDKKNVVDALDAYVKDNGMVAVRDYVGSRGLPAEVEWNAADGTVSINGISFKPTYIIGGKAYIPQAELDEILRRSDNQTGIKKDTAILAESEEKYGGEVNRAFNDVMNFKDFSYDPNEDEAYRAFMDIYNKAVADEYAKNVAQAKFRTGGVASPAVMQGAAAVRESALDNAAGYIGQFEDRAYNKYLDERGFAKDKLTEAVTRMVNDYGLKSQANSTDLANYYNNINQGMANETFIRDMADRKYDRNLYEMFAQRIAENEAKLSDGEVLAQILKNDAARSNLNWTEILNSLGVWDTVNNSIYPSWEVGYPYNLSGADFSGVLNDDQLKMLESVMSLFK